MTVMTTIHVDPINGNNANSGLSDSTAVLTPHSALVKAAAFFAEATGDIEIALKDSWPINFASAVFMNATHNRPGKHRLRWRSYGGGGGATVTARTQLTGWEATPSYHSRAARALHAGNARDLFTDAGFIPRRATRGRNNSAYRIHAWENATKSVLIHEALAPAVAGVGGLEMVIPQGWSISYVPVAAITNGPTGFKRVFFNEPAASVLFEKGTVTTSPTDFAPGPYIKVGQRFWWANRVEFLANTGDFVKWGDYFYAVMPEGVTPATFSALGTYVPNGLQTLFNVTGNFDTSNWDDKIEAVDFDGFRAKHIGYVPTDYAGDGWLGYNANLAHRDGGFINLTGVITVRKAKSISIRRCRATQLLAGFLRVWDGVHGLAVQENAFHDMGACPLVMSGVANGTINGVPWPSIDTQPFVTQNVGLLLTDNVFRRTGQIYMGFTCFLSMWRGVRAQHNWFKEEPGGSILLGLGGRWYPTFEEDWVVSHNEIEDVLLVLTDAGALYSTGNQAGRMQTAPVPLHQLNVPLSARVYCNKLTGVYKADYDLLGGRSPFFYSDLGAQGNVHFLNWFKDGTTAFNVNGQRYNTYKSNRVENVETLREINYSALRIYQPGTDEGIRTWPPLNNPPSATDLEKWNGTGAYSDVIPFREVFPFDSPEAARNVDGTFNDLSRWEQNGPTVPWNVVGVGPSQAVRERYADIMAD